MTADASADRLGRIDPRHRLAADAGVGGQGQGSSPQPITGRRAAWPVAGRTGTAATCLTQTGHRPAIGVVLTARAGELAAGSGPCLAAEAGRRPDGWSGSEYPRERRS